MESIRNWAFQVGVVKIPTRQPDNEGLQMVELYHIKVLSLELEDVFHTSKNKQQLKFQNSLSSRS
jgi:hypothetical protein